MNNTPKILIAEDEPAIVDTIVYALELDGFKADSCSTGEEALALLEANNVALLILDVGLPDTNGFDLARDIRGRHSIPIIFLTARSDVIDRVVGLELGTDDYMTKPFSPRELTARVKAVLRRTTAGEANLDKDNASPHPHFAVYREQLQIRYHGRLLTLSRYEYRLLELLVRSPSRVYTRSQLMNHGWEEPDFSMERTVDTHIKTIRRTEAT